ncbi:MAG: hypothetical protein MJ033_05400 [Victivallaceae bacterium]|nr:hypothetical protein [Victivallaceae bacterium]
MRFPEILAVVRLLTFPLIAFFISLAGTKLAIQILPKFGMLDQPGGRHIHKQPVPRGGGIAVVVAFFLSLGAYFLWSPPTSNLFFRLLLPGGVLAILGVVDDRYDLSARLKLIVQILCAATVCFMAPCAMSIAGWEFPWFLMLGFTVLWVVGIINAFNLIDGMDGVAGGISSVSAGCLAIWFLIRGGHQDEVVVMLVLLGSCLGFLRYNFHPAKIFLGDVGSTFIGFVFAVTALSGQDRAATLTSLLVPLLAIGVPIFDEALAVWRRVVRKLLNPTAQGVMSADQDHLHHRLLRETGGQSKAAFVLYCLAGGFALLSILLTFFLDTAPGVAFFLLVAGIIVAIRHLAIPELMASANLVGKGFSLPRKGILINVFHPLFDLAMISGALFFSCRILHFHIHGLIAVMMLTPILLLLYVSGIYRVYWLRASITDYSRLLWLFLGGAMIACAIFGIARHQQWILIPAGRFVVLLLLFILLSLCLIVGERFFIRYAEGLWLFKLQQSRLLSNTERLRALIYGGGLFCRLFVTYHFRIGNVQRPCDFIGIVDDEPALQNMRINSLPVIGRSSDFDRIYEKTPFDIIIVASRNIPEEKLRTVNEFAMRHHLQVMRFSVQEEILDFSQAENKSM